MFLACLIIGPHRNSAMNKQHSEPTLLQVCRVNPGEKGKYIKIILSLLQSTSSAVVYECAVTLVSLSQAPTAIRAAANCYCQLLVSQSDNNVKLIVLDRLQVSHPYSLAEHARNHTLRKLMIAKELWCSQPVWILLIASCQLLACDIHVQWRMPHLPDTAALEQLCINRSWTTTEHIYNHLQRQWKCLRLPTHLIDTAAAARCMHNRCYVCLFRS